MKIALIITLLAVSIIPAFADHSEVTISTASGSGAPGCEETSQGCFIPKEVTLDVGGKVIFVNTDTAAHTFTAGTPTDGNSGTFDSSLVMAGSSYEWTPTTVGEFPYYCAVHPWMTGLIVVQEAGAEEMTEHTGEEMDIPPTDTDGDGIPDSSDSCITEPETVNGYRDTDGCPDVVPPTDTDGDGISDSLDQCPTQDETVNGYDDLDGCPDVVPPTDTDKDGILDYVDQCPTQKETVNGYDDLDGCPDEYLDEIDPIPDDLPSEIKIVTASGSGAPGCEETSQGCFIPKVASVVNGGKIIFVNTDTAAHTFTAGTPTDGPSGEFDSSLVMAGSSYEWTATREGEVPYFCMVHPWMTGIIFVGEGTYIPPTEDDFELQVIMENQVYDLSDTATVNLFIDGISTPQNVALEISDPRGTTVISRSFEVDSQGTSFEFRIDENFKTGTYKVVATTNNNGNTVTDVAYFKVISQYNSFKITSVQVTDQQGNQSNLQAGEMGFIKVNLEASKNITTLVTVNLFDSDLTSIGIGSIKTTLSSGNSEIILSFMIPSDVAVGPSNIYVNAFSDWPSNGGIPLTGEISITENIE